MTLEDLESIINRYNLTVPEKYRKKIVIHKRHEEPNTITMEITCNGERVYINHRLFTSRDDIDTSWDNMAHGAIATMWLWGVTNYQGPNTTTR